MEKQKLLLEQINLVANSNISDKHDKLAELLTTYYRYCDEKHLKPNIDIFTLGPLSYILESDPLIFELNTDDVANAFRHLQSVINNTKNGILDGISLEEAKLILNWNIQNTRTSLAKMVGNIKNDSLTGCCGYTQSLTLLPFMEAKLEVTINNVGNFPGAKFRHAFGTVKIPIKENNEITTKQFLLDASYRQFFTTAECNKGRYYLPGYDAGPAHGYYICQTEEGRLFATELLKKGFIELTPGNAKLYGNAFVCEGLNLTNVENQQIINQTPGIVYIHTINNNQESELNNDKEELEANGDIIVPPGLTNPRNL